MAGRGRQRAVGFIRDQIQAHLAGRTGSWLASFAELVDMAADRGAPMGDLATNVTALLGPGADGEVDDDVDREALIDALAGRWASIAPEDP